MSNLIIATDGTEIQFDKFYYGNNPREKLREVVGGELEFVNILYKGKKTLMVVNGIGGISVPLLPINRTATGHYYRASVMHMDGFNEERFQNWIKTYDFSDNAVWPIRGNVVIMAGVNIL